MVWTTDEDAKTSARADSIAFHKPDRLLAMNRTTHLLATLGGTNIDRISNLSRIQFQIGWGACELLDEFLRHARALFF